MYNFETRMILTSLTILMILVALEETLEALPALTIFVEPERISRPNRSETTQGTSSVVERVETKSIQKKKLNGYPSRTKDRVIISKLNKKKQARMIP